MATPSPLTGRRRRARLLALVSGAALVVAGLALLAVPASAHSAAISANCDHVTVNLTGFPSEGTAVHIAVQVGDVGSTAKDVTVFDQDMTVTVPISSLTSQLNGDTGNVVVDVTWNFFGQPQHEHESIPVTCGSKSTTSVESASSTSFHSRGSTSTTASTTATSVAAASSTSSASSSSSSTTIKVGGKTATAPGPTSEVRAASASRLPFTGSASLPLLVLGVAVLSAGALLTVAPKRRS